MGKLIRRLHYFFRQRQIEAELAEEIESHRTMEQRRLEQTGLSPADARTASRRTLGNVTLAREEARGVWIWPLLERIVQDTRHGLRVLASQPTFALTAILTLGIGVGATTAIVSTVQHELWSPLPFPQPERLVALFTTGPGPNESGEYVSAPDFLDWRQQTQSFESLAPYRSTERRTLRGRGVPESMRVLPVADNFLTILGRSPALGRAFGDEERAGGKAIILSDAGWRRLFRGDPTAIGQTVTLDDQPHLVIGVMPQAPLEFVTDPDAFVNLSLDALRDRGARNLSVIGRLKDGVSATRADADVKAIARRLAIEYPVVHPGRSARVADLRTYFGSNRHRLYFFLGAAVFVLLLASATVANLVLGRALARQREFAIRGALGGGGRALLRQLLVEGALVSLPGAAAGLLLTAWAFRALRSWLPSDYLSRPASMGIDTRVFLIALGLSALTTVVFGLVPALFATRRDLAPVLGCGSRSATGSPGYRRARHALVVVEVTIAFVLLAGAGLFLNSFIRLKQVPLGFDPDGRVTMRLSLTGDRYQDPRERHRFSEQLVEQVKALPGVTGAASATDVPLGSGPVVRFAAADKPRPAAGTEDRGIVRAVSPAYFEVLGIRVLVGRGFTRDDAGGAPRVAIVNERLARRLFAGGDAIGRELAIVSSFATWVTPATVRIVGVAENIKDVSVHEVDFDNVYLPLAQTTAPAIHLIVRTSVPPLTVTDSLRRQIQALDPRLPVISTLTMTDRVDDSLRGARFHLFLTGFFAVVAILLASVGIYGVMSYAVEQRTREFGVRLALGAQRAGILGLAIGQSLRLGLAGTAIGLGGSLLLARAIGDALFVVRGQHSGILYGVSLADPPTLTIAGVLLVGVAVLAALMPARRAARIDPMLALRHE
jgi:putative ABC transport system permease protein